MFDRIWVDKLPAVHLPSIWIYAKIGDAEGEYTFRIEIVKLENDEPIGRVVTPRSVLVDQLRTSDLVVKLPPMPITQLGTYEFHLFASDIWIGRTKMIVEKLGVSTS